MKALLQMKKPISSILILLFLLPLGCGTLFFYPSRQLYDNPTVRQFSPEDVFFKTKDGLTLHGWFFPAEGDNARATVLALHGNAQNLSAHVGSVLWLVKQGFNLFIIDYRGYGRSEGKAGIKGVHIDAEAAFETLLSMPRVKDGKIIVLGQSLGGAIAVYTAANSPHKDRIAALVIESAFAGYRLIARENIAKFIVTWPFQYPLSFLFNDDYSPVKWIAQVSPVPVLILQGEEDNVVPFHHAQLLYDAARQPKELWKSAEPGHVRSFADAGMRERLARYLEEQLGNNDQRLRK